MCLIMFKQISKYPNDPKVINYVKQKSIFEKVHRFSPAVITVNNPSK